MSNSCFGDSFDLFSKTTKTIHIVSPYVINMTATPIDNNNQIIENILVHTDIVIASIRFILEFNHAQNLWFSHASKEEG